MLTNYKKIAHSTTENTGQGRSQLCKKCALCGHFNHYKSMIHQTSTITAANEKIFALKQTLDCSNYGIYMATCRLCHKQYIGQTINKFLNAGATTDLFGINLNTTILAIKQYYYTITTPSIQNQILPIVFCNVCREPPRHLLSIYENIWLDQLNATINTNKMLLPSIK